MRRCYRHGTPDGVQVLVAVTGYKRVTPNGVKSRKRRSGFICVRRTRTVWLRRPAGFPYGKLRPFQLARLTLICLKNETKADAAWSWILFRGAARS